MNRAKKYFVNALLLSCVTVIMRAVSVSFNAFVTQKIGSEAVGLFTLVMSVYGFAVTLATSGVNLAAVRMTAEKLALCESMGASEFSLKKVLRKEMKGCLQYSFFFGLFASVLLFILSRIIGTYLLSDIRTITSLKVLSFALLPISLTSALSGYFTGLRKIYKNAAMSLLEQLVKITITSAALMVIAPKGIEYACLSVVGGSAISEGASLIVAYILYITDNNKTKGNSSSTPIQKKGSLSRAFEIAFPIATGSYVRQGLLCAEHIAIPSGLRKFGAVGSDALSAYGTLQAMAFPLIFFPSSIIGAFASLLIPELTECDSLGQTKKVRRISEKVVRFSLMFSIGCSGIFLAFGNDLGISIYSSTDAGKYICAFAPLVPIMYLDTAVDSILKGLGKQLYCMKVNIIDATVSLILVLVLVPIMGTWGYILCVYIAELLNATLSISKMISCTKIKISVPWIAKPILAILLSATIMRLFCSYCISLDNILLKILLTTVIYSAIVIPKPYIWKQKSYKRENSVITP